jgi:HD-like signal output (HDOD) protein
MPELSETEARKLLAGIVIPPRPSIVTAVLEERSRADPDLRRIAQLISNDVGLSAAVLKTVNSPLYGLRRQVGSIEQAVMLLGMKNVGALVMGLSLRNSVPSQGLNRFWDSAARTALVASHLAHLLGGTSREDAHLFGLFHDCGIPLLMQRFPDYKETLALANNAQDMSFTEVEDGRHQTNHAVVGSLLASNWNLPEHLRDGILHHHDRGVFQSELPALTLNLIAIVNLAEYVENSFSRLSADAEWGKVGPKVMAYLMLDEDALDDLIRDAKDMLEESEQ